MEDGIRLVMKIILRMWEIIVILVENGRRNNDFLMRINNIMRVMKSEKEPKKEIINHYYQLF